MPSIYLPKTLTNFHPCTQLLCPFSLYGKRTKSLKSRAGFEVRWCNHWSRCHSFLNSLSGCLNWPILCQLWTEVWIWFNMWRLLRLWQSLSVPHPCVRQDVEPGKERREETNTGLIFVCVFFMGPPFSSLHFKQENQRSTIVSVLHNLHACLI